MYSLVSEGIFSLFGLTPRISSAASITAGRDFSHLLLTLTALKRYKLLANAISTSIYIYCYIHYTLGIIN